MIILQCKWGNRTIFTLWATWSLASGKQTLLPLGFVTWYTIMVIKRILPQGRGIRIMSQKLVFKSRSEMCQKCFKNWIVWKVFKGVTNPTKEYIQRNSVLWLFYDSPIGLIRNLFNIMRKKPHNPKIETHNHHNWDCNWCHAWHQSFRSRKVSKHIRLRHKSSSLLL